MLIRIQKFGRRWIKCGGSESLKNILSCKISFYQFLQFDILQYAFSISVFQFLRDIVYPFFIFNQFDTSMIYIYLQCEWFNVRILAH